VSFVDSRTPRAAHGRTRNGDSRGPRLRKIRTRGRDQSVNKFGDLSSSGAFGGAGVVSRFGVGKATPGKTELYGGGLRTFGKLRESAVKAHPVSVTLFGSHEGSRNQAGLDITTFDPVVAREALPDDSAFTPANRAGTATSRALYAASEALIQATLQPDDQNIGRAASLLHRAVHEEAERRPRHAALALAVWDALTCTDGALSSGARRKVLWECGRRLLTQHIPLSTEMGLLRQMETAGLQRVPPFEETVVSRSLPDQT
jgi:hypothetical protein